MTTETSESKVMRMGSLDQVWARLLLLITAAIWPFTLGYVAPNRKTWAWLWIVGFFLCALILLTSSSWLMFAVGWEGITVAIVALLSLKPSGIAVTYAASQLAGAILLFAGFAATASATGVSVSTAIAGLGDIQRETLGLPNLWLTLGFAVKAGIFGVHQWLPSVHGNAPAPVSALLSGFSVTLGIWGMMRFSSTYSPILVVWGLGGVLYGGLKAWGQQDVKKLLAYSTISHTGLMLFGVGLGTLAAHRAVAVHVLGHGLFKALLFLWAGYVEKVYGTRDIFQLAEEDKRDPLPTAVLVVGALGLIGVPLFAGYPGKYLLKGLASGFNWANPALLAASVVSGAYGSKLLLAALPKKWVTPRSDRRSREERPSVAREAVSSPSRAAGARVRTRMTSSLVFLGSTVLLYGVHPALVGGKEIPWSPGYTLSSPTAVLSALLLAALGAAITWLVYVRGIGRQAYRYLALGWDTAGIRWMARTLVNETMYIGRELHNGDITRYLQWFLAAAAIALVVVRISAGL